MCVITDSNHIVVSVSFIMGTGNIPLGYHVYFPVVDAPLEGTYFKP